MSGDPNARHARLNILLVALARLTRRHFFWYTDERGRDRLWFGDTNKVVRR